MAQMAAAPMAIARGSIPALAAAAPPIMGGLVVVAVLMGPTAMTPSDAAAAAEVLLVRALLWVAWLAALAGAASRLFHEPSLLYLRWLPIPAWLHAATAGLLLAAIESPWALFWGLASGPLVGVTTLAAAMAFHAAIVARARSRWERVVFVAGGLAAAGATALPPTPRWASLGVSALVLLLAVPATWRRAGEAPPRPIAPRPRGGPVRALSTVLVASQLRVALLGRVVVAAVVFGGLGGAFVRVNQITGASGILVASTAALLGSVGVSAAAAIEIAASWRALRWLLRVSLATAAVQATALAIAAAVVGLFTGASIGAVLAASAGMAAPAALVAIAASGLSSATLSVCAVTAAARSQPRQPASVWSVAIGVALGFSATFAFAGALGFAIAPALVAVAAVNLGAAAAAPAPQASGVTFL